MIFDHAANVIPCVCQSLTENKRNQIFYGTFFNLKIWIRDASLELNRYNINGDLLFAIEQ